MVIPNTRKRLCDGGGDESSKTTRKAARKDDGKRSDAGKSTNRNTGGRRWTQGVDAESDLEEETTLVSPAFTEHQERVPARKKTTEVEQEDNDDILSSDAPENDESEGEDEEVGPDKGTEEDEEVDGPGVTVRTGGPPVSISRNSSSISSIDEPSYSSRGTYSSRSTNERALVQLLQNRRESAVVGPLQQKNMDKLFQEWGRSITNIVKTDVFYIFQFAKGEAEKFGSTFQKLTFSYVESIDPEHGYSFWEDCGRKYAREALNQKRKTVVQAMKIEFEREYLVDRDECPCLGEHSELFFTNKFNLVLVTGLYKNDLASKWLPAPVLLVGHLLNGKSDHRTSTVDTTTDILRQKDEYSDFLYVFGKWGANRSTFVKLCRHKFYSDFVPSMMEAFLVTTYIINYQNWIDRIENPDSNLSKKGRGGIDGGGWSEEQVAMYYKVRQVIADQRKIDIEKIQNNSTHVTFDDKLRKMWMDDYDGKNCNERKSGKSEHDKWHRDLDAEAALYSSRRGNHTVVGV
jgi:hypothetical protein